MKQAYRLSYGNGQSVDVTAESIPDAVEQGTKFGLTNSQLMSVEVVVNNVQDFIACSTPIKDSPYTLRRMSSGKLYVLHSSLNETQDVTESRLLQAIYTHISHLECCIYEFNSNIKQLETHTDASDTFHKLRELCGYIEDGTDTVFKTFQDDTTKSWYVVLGNAAKPVHYVHDTLQQAVNAAYEARFPINS